MTEVAHFAITFLIMLDIVLSLMTMIMFGDTMIYCWTCRSCGTMCQDTAFSISLWRRLTHRCDEHLT